MLQFMGLDPNIRLATLLMQFTVVMLRFSSVWFRGLFLENLNLNLGFGAVQDWMTKHFLQFRF